MPYETHCKCDLWKTYWGKKLFFSIKYLAAGLRMYSKQQLSWRFPRKFMMTQDSYQQLGVWTHWRSLYTITIWKSKNAHNAKKELHNARDVTEVFHCYTSTKLLTSVKHAVIENNQKSLVKYKSNTRCVHNYKKDYQQNKLKGSCNAYKQGKSVWRVLVNENDSLKNILSDIHSYFNRVIESSHQGLYL